MVNFQNYNSWNLMIIMTRLVYDVTVAVSLCAFYLFMANNCVS